VRTLLRHLRREDTTKSSPRRGKKLIKGSHKKRGKNGVKVGEKRPFL